MSMDATMNNVVNNLFDKFGEVIKAVEPIMVSVGSISQTVVQETANAGFAYTMIGGGLNCFAHRLTTNEGLLERIFGWTIFSGIVFGLIGLICVVCNVQFWIAPTKTVILEVIDKLT